MKSFTCRYCHQGYPTKSELFSHINASRTCKRTGQGRSTNAIAQKSDTICVSKQSCNNAVMLILFLISLFLLYPRDSSGGVTTEIHFHTSSPDVLNINKK